jgi:phosphoglycolate phosphatase-like HAD superfamily hydrolase
MHFFFDLDGTILDTSQRYYFIYYNIIKELGGSPLTKNVYWNCKSNKVSEYEIAMRSHLPQSLFNEYNHSRINLIESDKYLKFDKVWSELFDFIPSSKIFSKILLVTLRKKRQQLINQLNNLGISDWFENIITVEYNDINTKRHLLKVDRILQIYPNNLSGIFVGDTETDLRAGKILGLKTIAVTYGIRSTEYLTHEKPDTILNSPKDLVNFIQSL